MPAAPLRLVVHGAAGRMGQRVIAGALAALRRRKFTHHIKLRLNNGHDDQLRNALQLT